MIRFLDPVFAATALLVSAAVFLVLVRTAYGLSPTGFLRRRLRRRSRRVRRVLRGIAREARRRERGLDRAMRGFLAAQERTRMQAVPVEELKSAGATRVRWAALRERGLRSLADVAGLTARRLEDLPGIGAKTSARVVAAALELAERIATEAPDLPAPALDGPAEREVAAAALGRLDLDDDLGPARDALAREAQAVAEELLAFARASSLRAWATRRCSPSDLEAGRRLARRIETLVESPAWGELERRWRALPPARPRDARAVRDDARDRWSELVSLFEASLVRLGHREAREGAATAGRLPAEIVARVRAEPLDTAGLDVELRGYQRFGARYLLAQRRTILGDEMGLGKTIEALAVMTHLWSEARDGRPLFLVIAPAGLIWNWVREADRRAPFPARALHGDELEAERAAWLSEGGLGVTSYATLRLASGERELLPPDRELAFLVADEAHYLKNPRAGRTRAAGDMVARAARVSFLSGTPQENHPREFLNLIRMVRPDVAARLMEAGDFEQEARALRSLAGAFHEEVAGVYLRRNQDDVLRELPARIEKEEWVRLGPRERASYRAAVLAEDFMGMRRATTLAPEGAPSAKLDHLEALLEDHRESGRKVLVFSYFLDVLEEVERRFSALGRIRGDTPPRARMELVDRFHGTKGHALLALQIESAGTGLNLQGASVVVLLEPQLKPTTEEQAIARAHRMGQTERVIVHRLLARDTVDERIVRLLAEKRDLFEAFAKPSGVKDAAPDAVFTGLARRLLEEERAELA